MSYGYNQIIKVKDTAGETVLIGVQNIISVKGTANGNTMIISNGAMVGGSYHTQRIFCVENVEEIYKLIYVNRLTLRSYLSAGEQ